MPMPNWKLVTLGTSCKNHFCASREVREVRKATIKQDFAHFADLACDFFWGFAITSWNWQHFHIGNNFFGEVARNMRLLALEADHVGTDFHSLAPETFKGADGEVDLFRAFQLGDGEDDMAGLRLACRR